MSIHVHQNDPFLTFKTHEIHSVFAHFVVGNHAFHHIDDHFPETPIALTWTSILKPKITDNPRLARPAADTP